MSGQALKLTADLIDRRNAMRRLLGDLYEEHVGLARKILVGHAAAAGLELADATLAIARKMDGANVDPNLIFCAFVEESESGAA